MEWNHDLLELFSGLTVLEVSRFYMRAVISTHFSIQVCLILSILFPDPRSWNSSQVKIWISQFLHTCDVKNPGEVIVQLEKTSINGATLAGMDQAEFVKLFGGVCGDIMHSSFQSWVDGEFHALPWPITFQDGRFVSCLECVGSYHKYKDWSWAAINL